MQATSFRPTAIPTCCAGKRARSVPLGTARPASRLPGEGRGGRVVGCFGKLGTVLPRTFTCTFSDAENTFFYSFLHRFLAFLSAGVHLHDLFFLFSFLISGSDYNAMWALFLFVFLYLWDKKKSTRRMKGQKDHGGEKCLYIFLALLTRMLLGGSLCGVLLLFSIFLFYFSFYFLLFFFLLKRPPRIRTYDDQ